ncbi:MAG: ATP-binding protein [Dorea sp.]
MKLRTKIQKSMILVIATTLLVAYAMTTFVVYRQTTGLMEAEICQEADYIKAAIDILGIGYLEEMDHVRENTRITLIDKEGVVLYDSKQDEVTLENHKDRPEIREALERGRGQDIRKSNTLRKEMFYYALRLEDGNILRVSKMVDSALHTAMSILPFMGVIGIVMLIFAGLLSRTVIRKLTRPINELDLEKPLENDTYEELSPLLERIDQQNKEKDAISNMRKEFTANVSHELKTPLTSISGYAEIMKNGMVRPEDMNNFAERIYNEASRLIKLVEDIIKISKLDEGAVEIEKENVDLFCLTREIVHRLSLQSSSKNVHVMLTGESAIIYGVYQVLDEMIYNVCENAIKYNREGGTVSVWVGNTLEGIKISVTDTGIGIPEEDIERVFERFYRVDKSHSKKTGGTGLGLSIVKHGAYMHHAKIKVTSKVGSGTKMEILFCREQEKNDT